MTFARVHWHSLHGKLILPITLPGCQAGLLPPVLIQIRVIEASASAPTLTQDRDVTCHLVVLGPKPLSRGLCYGVILILMKGDPRE